MELEERLAFLRSPRSVRHFSQLPVPEEYIGRILDAARWTGSARNRQPWRFRAVSDRATRTALSRLGEYAGHLAGAPLVLVVLSEDNGRADTEFDVGRISQTVVLAAHALGLGSCLATLYPPANVDAAARLLRVGSMWLPHHAISIGWPAPNTSTGSSAIPVGRRSVDDLLGGREP
ncbi:nitroreductase family protein [Pseudonocardia spinosispora]|uniref:nitroreductase family protein n=1 Tax=Pseudonocardia spinosispora TaxID=103441 RepID=UPI0003F7C5B0|nr:nitroreductase family protein [Pseudonocardia spinosispora]